MTTVHFKMYQEQLSREGYAVLPADALISASERRELAATVFVDELLETDLGNVNPTRRRADDILFYTWNDADRLEVVAHEGNHPDPNRLYINYRVNHEEDRHYKRLLSQGIPTLRLLIESVLHLVPPSSRRRHGQLDVHAFRTSSTVVQRPHRDGGPDSPVDWVVSYIVAKSGKGAITKLYEDEAASRLVLQTDLHEGQLAIHRDNAFFHYVGNLESSDIEPHPQRDALIMTIRPRLDGKLQ